MKYKIHFRLIGLLLALTTCSASAMEMPELAKSKNCVNCHAIDRKIVGPAWMKVAKRYEGKPEASRSLIEKIKNGGSGVWGSMPMPAQTVSQEEAEKLVAYILGLNQVIYAAK